jgi:hypothetical protein
MPVAVATNELPGLLDVSSSGSALDAAGEIETVIGPVALEVAVGATDGFAALAATKGIDVACCAAPFGLVEAETLTATR